MIFKGSLSVLLFLAHVPVALSSPPSHPEKITPASTQPGTSEPKLPIPSPSLDPVELKIAAAEQIWRGAVQETTISYGPAMYAVLSGIVNQHFSANTDADFQFLLKKSSFFQNLIERSPAVHRHREYLRINSNPIGSQSAKKVIQTPLAQLLLCFKPLELANSPITNVQDFCSEIAAQPENLRAKFLFQKADLLPALTHLEFFQILSLIPRETQLEVHDWLLKTPGVFTRLDFFESETLPELYVLHLHGLIKQLSTPPSNSPVQVNPTLTAARVVCRNLADWDKIQVYTDILKSVHHLGEMEFLELISDLSSFTVWPSSEKPLVGLRDDLRTFTQNSGWTASDLHEMNVSLNLALFFHARKLLNVDSGNLKEHVLISNLANTILLQSQLKPISVNPNKSHLKAPSERGVSVEQIYNLKDSRI